MKRWVVRKDGEVKVAVDTEMEAFAWLLKNQGQSTYYATQYGGYTIENEEVEG